MRRGRWVGWVVSYLLRGWKAICVVPYVLYLVFAFVLHSAV